MYKAMESIVHGEAPEHQGASPDHVSRDNVCKNTNRITRKGAEVIYGYIALETERGKKEKRKYNQVHGVCKSAVRENFSYLCGTL